MSCWRIATAAPLPRLSFAPTTCTGRAGKFDMIVVAGGALDHIAGADEARDEFRLRPVVDVLGRAELRRSCRRS